MSDKPCCPDFPNCAHVSGRIVITAEQEVAMPRRTDHVARLEMGPRGFNAYLDDQLFAASSSVSTMEKVVADLFKLATGQEVVVLIRSKDEAAKT